MTKFDEVINRRNTKSVKWDLTEKLFKEKDVLPMWVADMDFATPQAVQDAISKRASHGIYGYTFTDESVHEAIQSWLARRHQWEIDSKWITFSPGVVPSLHTIIEAVTQPEDRILIQTPVYPPFFDVIKKHQRTIVENPLQYNNYRYEIDFDDFEQQLKNGIKAFILCNPHNPVGRVWTKDELQRMAELCLQNNTMIISDEIHADLIYQGHTHIPIASLGDQISEQTITCLAPSKTFNLAGLQASYIVTPSEHRKKQIDDQFTKQGMKMLNTFAITAMEAAYSDGEAWLDDLLTVLQSHKAYVKDMLETHTSIRVVEPEGTYLLWLDCRNLELSQEQLKHFMQQEAKVGLNDGASFGSLGTGFMRMNIACPRPLLEEGINRLIQATQK
ncbi:MalY/PatB family protein [Pontibacillus litoralis]|uniref:cysteine-S-conjugate beta-lyase n=1 Tax=Pontibacillus litoralis JSM 072002 TaxID=1385512 RepID=A0A0A5G6C5_9BACI|nr:PatB family C-S lyase [Pontibacillus litoralis]KGX86728.1 cystathionine beta-lyase [Pontibacillus litoralis JSM 072002]